MDGRPWVGETSGRRDEADGAREKGSEHNGTIPVCVQRVLLRLVNNVCFRPVNVQPDSSGDKPVSVAITCQSAAVGLELERGSAQSARRKELDFYAERQHQCVSDASSSQTLR